MAMITKLGLKISVTCHTTGESSELGAGSWGMAVSCAPS